MKAVYYCLVASLLFIASCTKQPGACIKTSKTLVDVGETVVFESCATDAAKLEWDFGDGTTSTESKPSHSWNTPGVYIVQLKALSKNGKKFDRYSVAITVKGNTRYLTKIVLKAFAAKKPDNSNWDAGPLQGGAEPDIFVQLLPADGSGIFSTNTKSNIKNDDLPYTWNVRQQNVFLSPQNWTVEVRDDDSFQTTLISEIMINWTVNLGTEGTNGVITLTHASGYTVELHYENRQ
jgi:PKD repeat protein